MSRTKKRPIGLFIMLILCAALLLALLLGAAGVQKSAAENGLAAVQSAVIRAAINCYSIEGAYPNSLDYLKKHYGLAYDEGRYLVSYDAFSQNLLPEVYVFQTGGEPHGD